MKLYSLRATWLAIAICCASIGLGCPAPTFQFLSAALNGSVTLECNFTSSIQMDSEIIVTLSDQAQNVKCKLILKTNESSKFSENHDGCLVNRSDNKVDFTLLWLRKEDRGMYRCNVEIVFPPPYQRLNGSATTMLIVEENECKQDYHSDSSMTWLSVVTGCALLMYSTVMTVIVAIYCIKFTKEKNTQNDYMNMKPRGLKKNQGVIHPTRNGRY
ncbi:T-cell-specific surface glycoprotein CD28 [Amia ocellicauda]|uniref:T-cell-specific surface glycoprotein CD28 n=1 Tax=Amia ocellicauda TaxID=2972642 RepID=UPI0034642F82